MKRILLLIVFLLVGCATTWIGKSVEDLIAAKGEPGGIVDDGKGGMIYIYTSYESHTDPGGYSSSPGPTGYYKDGKYVYIPGTDTRKDPSRTSVSKEWRYYVDSSGTIYNAKYDRDAHTRTLSSEKTLNTIHMSMGGKTTDDRLMEYNDSISKNPKDPLLYAERGRFYASLNRTDEALADYNKSINLAPNKNGYTYYSRGKLYQKIGKREEAKEDFRKACDLGYSTGCVEYNMMY